MVSIVGRNGAGKSTLSKLICGFETPDQGTLLFNGKDFSGENIQSLGSLSQGAVPVCRKAQKVLFDETSFEAFSDLSDSEAENIHVRAFCMAQFQFRHNA